MKHAISSVILAGGENRRFPILKGFININGVPIIEKNLFLLKGIFKEVFISTNNPQAYFYLEVPLFGDVLPSAGPMSGIHTSLMNSVNDSVFVTACDMPFIKREIVEFICRTHNQTSEHAYGATIPVYRGRPQPLLGIYRKSILPMIEESINNKKTALIQFLEEIKAYFIEETDIIAIDDGMSFVNINTPEDYEKIRR